MQQDIVSACLIKYPAKDDYPSKLVFCLDELSIFNLLSNNLRARPLIRQSAKQTTIDNQRPNVVQLLERKRTLTVVDNCVVNQQTENFICKQRLHTTCFETCRQIAQKQCRLLEEDNFTFSHPNPSSAHSENLFIKIQIMCVVKVRDRISSQIDLYTYEKNGLAFNQLLQSSKIFSSVEYMTYFHTFFIINSRFLINNLFFHAFQYLLTACSVITIVLLLMFGVYLARPIKIKGLYKQQY